MSEAALHRVDLALRRSLAFATALLALAFDLLPLPGASPQAVAPLLTLTVLYHWSIQRPDLLTPLSAFLLGLARDLAGGLPLGLHALVFLLVPALLRRVPRGPLQRSLALSWLLLLPVVAAVGLARWLLAALVWLQPVPGRVFLLEAALTWALYPLVAGLLAPVGRLLPRTGHVPGG